MSNSTVPGEHSPRGGGADSAASPLHLRLDAYPSSFWPITALLLIPSSMSSLSVNNIQPIRQTEFDAPMSEDHQSTALTGGVRVVDLEGAAVHEPDRTRPVNLYRILPGRSFEDCWSVAVDAADDYASIEVDGLADDALLVFGERPPRRREWVEHVHALTGLDLDYHAADASAVLFVQVDGDAYALTFGNGWRLLTDDAVDREFGLEFALRALDADAVRQIKRQYVSARARVDVSVVPAGQELWSFGIREHAELVRQLIGSVLAAARVDLSHARRTRRRSNRVNVDCADRIRLPLPDSPQHLISDLREISRVLRDRDVDPELAPLRWIRRLTADQADRVNEAWAGFFALLDARDDAVSISYPAHYHNGPEVSRFVGNIGTHRIDGPDLVLEDFKEGIAGRDRATALRQLRTSKITGLDESGNPVGRDEAATKWLTAEVDLPDARLVLLDGDWYDITKGYEQHVSRIVEQAFTQRPSWSLPAWIAAPPGPNGRREERYYNSYVAEVCHGFLCLDRKLVRTRAHRKGFEACDLLGPNNELVHVKKVSSRTGSGPLSHLFAQGIVAVESLTDRGTWDDFVDLVRQQDPARAQKLGNRPHTLVFAMHRTNGVLTPERLFTFARSELASAALLFTKLGVNLQICIIP